MNNFVIPIIRQQARALLRASFSRNLSVAKCGIVVIAGATLFSGNAWGAPPTWPLKLEQFAQMCLSGQESCIYARLRFESANSANKDIHIYRRLATQSDIDAYDSFIESITTPGKIRGLKKSSVQRYDRAKRDWVALPLTNLCKYCVNVDEVVKQGPEWLRVHVVQQIAPDPNSFLAFGDVVRKDEPLKVQIVVTAPSYVNSKDRSPIYIDSRIKGRHAATSFIEGGITIDLDGNEVPWNFPDYVAISPVKSWAVVAAEYRKREASLLINVSRLPVFREGTPKKRLDGVEHQLQTYKIRYDAFVGGAFPSLSPDQVIASRHGDCKALATLAGALLKRSGIQSYGIVLSGSSQPPLSFSVPGAFWNPLHVILYIPELDVYIDPSRIASFGAEWQESAAHYRGSIGLSTKTGAFVVIH